LQDEQIHFADADAADEDDAEDDEEAAALKNEDNDDADDIGINQYVLGYEAHDARRQRVRVQFV
jgi:hypothetical protein